MKARAITNIPHAFVLSEVEIRKLWALLSEPQTTVTAAAHCDDRLVRSFETVDDLLSYENAPRSAIKSIDFSSRSDDDHTTAQIYFGSRYSIPIKFTLSGEERKVMDLQSSIDDILNGTRAWYSRIATVDLFYVFMPLLFSVGAMLQITALSKDKKIDVSLQLFSLSIGLTIIVVAFIALVVWTTGRLRRRFFPIAVFAIGQGITRHSFNDQIRWVVIVGFVISVVASVVVAPLLSK